MFLKHIISICALLLLTLSSCKKEQEEPIKTIYPLPYLPVYPGSKWRYLNQNGDTITLTCAPTYQLHNYKSEKLRGALTDPVYVPIWNGVPVYGYSTPLDNKTAAFDHRGLEQVPFLSEKQGEYWINYASQYGTSFSVVENTDTNIWINNKLYNNVIVVKNYATAITLTGKHLRGIAFFSKNIGLINQIIVTPYDTIETKKIIDYHINY